MNRLIEASSIGFDIPEDARPLGTRVFEGLLTFGASAMTRVERMAREQGRPVAAMSRVRGTGRGVHFGSFIEAMEEEHPLRLESPFEGSDLVSGGAWIAERLLSQPEQSAVPLDAAVAKLRWAAGADDLPLHVHDHSARFIIVLEGRGFFHLSDQSTDRFDGLGVRSIPARERDIFAFTPGLLHTFSTSEYAMTLLSVQMPYLAFDDPDQYRLPARRWTARDNPEPAPPRVVCDPWWAIGQGGC
jgi:mannose-6-phosphate isomerase-like protein (cupin superfamily)